MMDSGLVSVVMAALVQRAEERILNWSIATIVWLVRVSSLMQQTSSHHSRKQNFNFHRCQVDDVNEVRFSAIPNPFVNLRLHQYPQPYLISQARKIFAPFDV